MRSSAFRFNMLYLLLLVLASILSFYVIFGSGFVGDLSIYIFLILGIIAVILTVTYVWQMPFKNKPYRVLFSFSGTLIIYNIFLSTLFLDPRAIQSVWLFIGTPVIMLAIWCFLVYRASSKNMTMHWLLWVLFIGILLFYAWHVTSFYYSNVIT